MSENKLDEETLTLIENHVGETVQEAEWLAELVRVYRLHHARCGACGFEACEHTHSPSCSGFITKCGYVAYSSDGARSLVCNRELGHEGPHYSGPTARIPPSTTETPDLRVLLPHCPHCKAVGEPDDNRHKPWCPTLGDLHRG